MNKGSSILEYLILFAVIIAALAVAVKKGAKPSADAFASRTQGLARNLIDSR